MSLILKNKDRIVIGEFSFKCCIGKNGLTKKKVEGDKKTPIGTFRLGNLFYRNDRFEKPKTKLKCIKIKKNMGWCDDPKDKENYNKLIKIKKGLKYENLYRRDHKYDYFITIKYNFDKRKLGKGSAIFIHLTKNYRPTAGCIALENKDFLILAKIISKKTKFKIG